MFVFVVAYEYMIFIYSRICFNVTFKHNNPPHLPHVKIIFMKHTNLRYMLDKFDILGSLRPFVPLDPSKRRARKRLRAFGQNKFTVLQFFSPLYHDSADSSTKGEE